MAPQEGIPVELWSALRSARLWREASDEAVEWLARVTTLADYEKGEVLFREGTCPSQVAVIVTGHVRGVYTADGHSVVLETSWPGDVIGAVAAFGQVPFECDIEAAEDVTVALIPLGTVKDLLATEPAVAMSVINEIALRWVSAVNVNKRNASDVVSRVVSYLADLPRIRLGGPAYAVEIPMARVELAGSLGTTPETLSRAFHALQDDGLIESHDRMIIVPDGEMLAIRGEVYRPGLSPFAASRG
jgi:CRP-like cAMP-binding protein